MKSQSKSISWRIEVLAIVDLLPTNNDFLAPPTRDYHSPRLIRVSKNSRAKSRGSKVLPNLLTTNQRNPKLPPFHPQEKYSTKKLLKTSKHRPKSELRSTEKTQIQ